MAWTAPRTWTDGELVTKAIMDPHVRDNFNAMGPHLVVRKTADESVTSSTVLQNDDSLLFAVAASEIWEFKAHLLVTAAAAGDFKNAWTFPSGVLSTTGIGTTAAGGVGVDTQGDSTSPSTAMIWTGGPTNAFLVIIWGVLVNGGSAGNLTLQWAQGTSSGTATVVKTNSTLWAVKLA